MGTASVWADFGEVASWVLVSMGVLLAVLLLRGDRARGRRRCAKCWYDMTGVPPPGLTCPECGRTARSEKGLFKTRRRWRRLWAITPVMLLAYGASVAVDVAQRGWPAAVPSCALAIAMPWLPGGTTFGGFRAGSRAALPPGAPLPDRLGEEIQVRLETGGAWQRSVLMELPLQRVQWRRSPRKANVGDVMDEWLKGAVYTGRLTDWQTKRLFRLTARSAVLVRERWPRDEPLSVRTEEIEWFDYGYRTSVRGEWPEAASFAIERGRIGPRWHVIGGPEGEEVRLVAWLDRDRYGWSRSAASPLLVRVPLKFSIERKESISEIVRPRRVELLTEAIVAGFVGAPTRSAGLGWSGHILRAVMPRGIGFAVEFELLRDGECVERTWYHLQSMVTVQVGSPGQFPVWGEGERSSEWRVRMRAYAPYALRELGCDEYWDGEMEFVIGADGKAVVVER